jgi:hypothetical protein
VELGQGVLGGGDRLGVLAVGQVVTGPAGAIAQRAQRPVDGGPADRPAASPQQVGQVGHGPGRHGVAVVEGRLVQDIGRQPPGRHAQLRRPAAPPPVGQPGPAFRQEAAAPGAQAGARPAQQAGRLRQRQPGGDQGEGIGAVPDAGVGVGAGEATQRRKMRGQIQAGPSATPTSSPVKDFCATA